MPIHRDLINAAKKTRSLKNTHLTEASRAIGLGLTASLSDEQDKLDELLRKLAKVEQKDK